MPDHGIDRDTTKVWLLGGGIASLAATIFMIREGDTPGRSITIRDQTTFYTLPGLRCEPPAGYKGAFDPGVLFMTSHDLGV
jgi:hypothetical protein